eukprot:361200-Chlamydomonas_euryale.AAC.2
MRPTGARQANEKQQAIGRQPTDNREAIDSASELDRPCMHARKLLSNSTCLKSFMLHACIPVFPKLADCAASASRELDANFGRQQLEPRREGIGALPP